MERAGRCLTQASTALEAQVTKYKAQDAASEESDRLATASEQFSAALERAAFVAGDLKKVFASVHLYAPLFNATLRLAAAAAPLATAPGSHVDRAAIVAIQNNLLLDRPTLYWWQQLAGSYALHVNWDTFVNSFSRACDPPQPLSGADTAIMKYILDPFDSGCIASWRYSELARALGTANNILHRLRELAGLRGFIGFASSTEADRLLAHEASGTLLVRVSKGRPSAWALASKDGWGRITHSVITPTPQGALIVADKSYNTFVALITEFRLGQAQPMLTRDPSFYGELVSTRADDMLQGKPQGTYLWRYSSKPGMLALSFVAKEGGYAQHITVEQTAAAMFKLEEHTHTYTSLSEVLLAISQQYKLSNPLLHPLWYLPEPDSLAPMSNSAKFTGATSPGRAGPRPALIGTRESSRPELAPPKVAHRGASPAPSPSDAAPIENLKTRPGTAVVAPLLASRAGRGLGDSEYDPMPIVPSTAPVAQKGSQPVSESVVFEALPVDAQNSRYAVPTLAISNDDGPIHRAAALESPSSQARPRQTTARKDGEYGFMLPANSSVPPPSPSTSTSSLASVQPAANPLRSPGRMKPAWAPTSGDGESYDAMPLP